MNLYDVAFYIESPRNVELPDPLLLNDSVSIRREGAEYRIQIRFERASAQAAMNDAKEKAAVFCEIMALRDSSWQIVEDARQKVTRIDPPYVADGPVPPADISGGMMSLEGVEFWDPDGEKRRSGKVINVFAEGKLKHTNLSQETELFNAQENWPGALRTALRLLHLGVLQNNSTVNLVLSYTALETIADKRESPLLHQALGKESEREALLSDLRTALLSHGVNPDQAHRVMQSVENTRNQSQLDHFVSYFAERKINMPIETLRKIRRLRGQLMHNGSLATREDRGLINQFCLAVREGVRLDLGGTTLFDWIMVPPAEPA